MCKSVCVWSEKLQKSVLSYHMGPEEPQVLSSGKCLYPLRYLTSPKNDKLFIYHQHRIKHYVIWQWEKKTKKIWTIFKYCNVKSQKTNKQEHGLGVGEHACNSRTGEAEAEDPKFEVNMGYTQQDHISEKQKQKIKIWQQKPWKFSVVYALFQENKLVPNELIQLRRGWKPLFLNGK